MPNQCSNARAPWWISMPRPSTVRESPRSRAARRTRFQAGDRRYRRQLWLVRTMSTGHLRSPVRSSSASSRLRSRSALAKRASRSSHLPASPARAPSAASIAREYVRFTNTTSRRCLAALNSLRPIGENTGQSLAPRRPRRDQSASSRSAPVRAASRSSDPKIPAVGIKGRDRSVLASQRSTLATAPSLRSAALRPPPPCAAL